MAWKREKNEAYSDADLIEGCKKGNPHFQEVLYKRFFSFAMSICIRYTPKTDDVIEVVNDSFLKVFENISKYDSQKPFNSWFSKILVNTAIDSFRKNLKFQVEVSLNGIVDTEEPEPQLTSELSVNEITSLFAKLPETYRITFNLYEIEGYSHEEIGEMLGVTAATSRSNLTRAKKMLRSLYEKNFNEIKSYHERV